MTLDQANAALKPHHLVLLPAFHKMDVDQRNPSCWVVIYPSGVVANSGLTWQEAYERVAPSLGLPREASQ